MNSSYENIIALPHPVSRRHAPMPLLSRAAQFAPFAALSGYGEALGQAQEEADFLSQTRWGFAEPFLDDSPLDNS